MEPWTVWAASIRAAYELDTTELELVRLAEDALRLASSDVLRISEKLAAAGRFQALVRQLALEKPDNGKAQTHPFERVFGRRAN